MLSSEQVKAKNGQYQEQILDLTSKIRDYEGKIEILISDNESINNILTSKSSEVVQLKEKMRQQEEQSSQKSQQIHINYEKQLQDLMDELKTVKMSYEQEITMLKNQVVSHEMNNRLQADQIKINQQETASLKEQLHSAIRDSDNLHQTMRDNYKETELQKEQSKKLQIEYKLNIDDLEKRLQLEVQQNQQKTNKINDLQAMIQSLQEETSRKTMNQQKLDVHISELTKDNQDLASKTMVL